MRKQPRFRKKIVPPPTKHVLLITFIFFTIFTFVSLIIINNGIKPVMLDIATTRTEQMANRAMGIAINKKMAEDIDADELVEIDKDEEGNIVSIGFNTVVENRVQRNVQYRVENFLKELEQGNVPAPGDPLKGSDESTENSTIEDVKENPTLLEIPIGQVLGIPLLANLGPMVPVNLDTIGYVSTEVKSTTQEVGPNGAYFIVYVHIEVEVSVVIPFGTKPARIEQDIPITRQFSPGEVPLYYSPGGNNDNDPNFSIPMDPLKKTE